MRPVTGGIAKQKAYLLEKLGSDEVLGSARSMTRPAAIVVPYDPSEETDAREVAAALVSDLAALGHTVAVVDLYRIVLDVLDDDDLFNEQVEIERTFGKQRLIQELKDAADIEYDIVPRIKDAIREQRGEMLFLTGVGACYPFLRTHQLIDENVLTVDVPVVLFFPGSYKAKADGSVPLDILNIPQGQGGGLFYRARNVHDL